MKALVCGVIDAKPHILNSGTLHNPPGTLGADVGPFLVGVLYKRVTTTPCFKAVRPRTPNPDSKRLHPL